MIALPRPSRVIGQTRARLSAPGIDAASAREVLTPFGLAPTERPRNLGGGRRSRNVVVATSRGPVVIKRYRAQWDEGTVRYGHSILRRLEELELAAPRLVRTVDGDSVVSVGGAVYAVFELVEGRSYASSYLRRRDRLSLLASAGAALGAMHRGLEGFEPAGHHHMGFVSLGGPRSRGADWYRRTIEELRPGELREGAEPLVARAEALSEDIAALEAALDARDLPRTVIHGDFGLHNVVFRRDAAVPIDVELARLDHRVTDLILLLGRFVDADPEHVDVEGLRALLAPCLAAWPLSSEERAAMGDAWRFQQLTSAVRGWWSARASSEPAARIAGARRALDRATWFEEHPDAADRLFGPATARSAHGSR